ncbi:MAG: MFS transporter [Acidobacteria bacterium]|nr:MFS transporter [Acidobacteriota bacterium]
MNNHPTPIKHLRWYIGGLLFLSTVINYIDRQTLSVLAPTLKTQFHWTNTDYSYIIIAFRLAYAFGQTASGRLLDWVGTRKGLTIGVAWYSIAAMLTSLASGLWSFCGFRFLLGAGESANWPGATKAVSEWFPRRESGWAVALFDSGSSIGGAIAPFIVLGVYKYFGSWQPAFIVTGTLGFLWLALFRWFYHRPEDHPRLSDEERELILSGRGEAENAGGGSPTVKEGAEREKETPSFTVGLPPSLLLRLPQTWGVIISKSLTDPIWFFITEWFGIYLVTKGFDLDASLLGWWSVFIAADAGNFFGGGLSSYLIKRGWGVGNARKVIAVIGGLGMTLLIPAVYTTSFYWIIFFFAISTLCYAAFSTVILNFPADLYRTNSVASVSGMSGTGAGICTIIAMLLVGRISDKYSFEPILIAASIIPLFATLAVLALIRNNKATEKGIVNPI